MNIRDFNLDFLNRELYTMEEFDEFCETVDSLEDMLDPILYLEARETPMSDSILGKAKAGAQATLRTTGDVYKLWDKTTDASGMAIKNVWDLLIRMVNFAIKIITFIIRVLGNLPLVLIRLAERLSKIPKDVIQRIRGDVSLYITAVDIQPFYRTDFPNIISFIKYAEVLAKAGIWTVDKRGGVRSNREARKMLKEMRSKHKSLDIKFTPSLINMNSEQTREIYFGDVGIKFNDLDGKSRKGSYLNTLKMILSDMAKYKEPLSTVESSLRSSFSIAGAEDHFSKLDEERRRILRDAVVEVTEVVKVLGRLTRVVSKDLKTMESTIKKLESKNKTTK